MWEVAILKGRKVVMLSLILMKVNFFRPKILEIAVFLGKEKLGGWLSSLKSHGCLAHAQW